MQRCHILSLLPLTAAPWWLPAGLLQIDEMAAERDRMAAEKQASLDTMTRTLAIAAEKVRDCAGRQPSAAR